MFDEQKAEQICGRIACEPVSLQAVLRDMEGGPSSAEFYRWLADVPSFRENYARAREAQGDVDADMIADVRKRMLDGELTPEQARVAIDSLKWSAGKRKPKTYGDKLQVDQDVRLQVELIDATTARTTAQLVRDPLPALAHAKSEEDPSR